MNLERWLHASYELNIHPPVFWVELVLRLIPTGRWSVSKHDGRIGPLPTTVVRSTILQYPVRTGWSWEGRESGSEDVPGPPSSRVPSSLLSVPCLKVSHSPTGSWLGQTPSTVLHSDVHSVVRLGGHVQGKPNWVFRLNISIWVNIINSVVDVL